MIKTKRIWMLTGLCSILGLILLAIIFYQERATFCDMAYMLVVNLIRRKPSWYFVRVGAIIPQFFTLSAIYAHCSLRAAMVIHSISTLLFYLIIYLIAVRYSRTRLLFIAIPINLLLMVNEVFFWPISEVPQGLILLCLYGVVLYEDSWDRLPGPLRWMLHLVVILWIQFLHPLLIFPIGFLIIYFYEGRQRLFSIAAAGHIAIACFAFLLRYMAARHDIYETNKLKPKEAIIRNLPHFFDLGSLHAFGHKLTSAYLCYIILFICSIAWLLIRRHYVRAAIVFISSVGYWFLIMVITGTDSRYYLENMLLFLGFIVALVLVLEIIPALGLRYTVSLFVIVAVIQLSLIYSSHPDYTARLHMYDPYIHYCDSLYLSGVLVQDTLVDEKKAIVTWSAAYETILLSSLRSPDSCVIVHVDSNFNNYQWALWRDSLMLTKHWVWSRSEIPPEYFRMHGSHYEVLTKLPWASRRDSL